MKACIPIVLLICSLTLFMTHPAQAFWVNSGTYTGTFEVDGPIVFRPSPNQSCAGTRNLIGTLEGVIVEDVLTITAKYHETLTPVSGPCREVIERDHENIGEVPVSSDGTIHITRKNSDFDFDGVLSLSENCNSLEGPLSVFAYEGVQKGEMSLSGQGDCGCRVGPIAEITDPEALNFELIARKNSGSPPFESLYAPNVDPLLSSRIHQVFGAEGIRRTSGYRPPEYQSHLRDLRRVFRQYDKLPTPYLRYACRKVRENYRVEMELHGIKTDPVTKEPSVSGNSAHNRYPAQAVDITKWIPPYLKEYLAFQAYHYGLKNSCGKDYVHYYLRETAEPCGSQVIKHIAQSPLDILVTDPTGRRVGFDRFSETVINEIGEDAYYSGRESEPEFITIDNALPGKYTSTAVGTGDGPYTLTLERYSSHGELAERYQKTGTTTFGQILGLSIEVSIPIAIDIKPGSGTNSINVNSKGKIPVAILSSEEFDPVAEVDISTIKFGKTGNEDSRHKCMSDADYNLDGTYDLMCHFYTQKTALSTGDIDSTLTGYLNDGTPIAAKDYIGTRPKKDNKKPKPDK